ncbi:S8 family serine peptidase [Hymenobacter sp. BT186]|uniref:S8 family serine peptidase n=1 Tax=Hymenobacter telluris TaxID=2816474 RepID=A0A939JAK5_9BACT|nr:S8 family peptidase [Hymenobacter telluris]MBO0359979.1 S8 family serine peptidase [Hymenobacter telluris]MBW3376006.1 S8 family peptidase [Hymenobacter norwichensis]
MSKLIPSFKLVLLSVATCFAFSGKAQQTGSNPAPIATGTFVDNFNQPATLDGTLVFKLKPEFQAQASSDGVAVPALNDMLRRMGVTRITQKFPHASAPHAEQPGAVDLRLIYQIWLDKAAPLAKVQQALLSTGTLTYVEPLYYRAPLSQPNDPLADSTLATGQYHLKNIRAYQAWNLTQGDSTVLIGITDTGFRLSHQDLAGQWQRNYQDPPDGIDNDNDGFVDNYRGWDFADRDNNPAANGMTQPLHGVHTAGAAAGRVGNGLGIAGVGYNCRFLPLKIYPSTNTGSFAGYEAIVYAADHGCKVINMSWGSAGGRSQFEQDAITYAAINHDVVLVASAGNTNAELDFYPASYDHVLSVGWTGADDVRASRATYSRRIDLVAPGDNIYTTWGDTDSDYIRATGSSFSAPLVSGAAALVRARFPQFTAAQVIAQLRATTDNIYNLPGNTPYAGKLGTGRLNVFRAVQGDNQHAMRITQRVFTPSKTIYQLNDTIRLAVEVQNLLQPVQNLTLTVTSLSPYLTVQRGTFTAGAVATLSRASNASAPFCLKVAAAAPVNTSVTIRYRLSDPSTGYEQDQYTTLLINPEYVVLNAGNLALTLTHRGSLGVDGLGSTKGEGVRYQGGASLIYEGGIMVGAGTTRVSSRLRNDRNGIDTDFFTQAQTTMNRQTLRADQEACGLLQDSLPSATRNRTVGVQIRQRGYSWAQAPHRDYVVLEYVIKNVTADTLKPLYAGLFADWDLGDYIRNAVAWDSVRNLSYAYNVNSQNAYIGLQWLRGGTPISYAIDVNAPTGLVRLSDGFSRAEKMTTLANGTRQRTTGLTNGTDIAQVVGAKLPWLAPSDSVVVALAVVAAPTLAQLQAAASAAQVRYSPQQALNTRSALAAGAWQLYPNPTTGQIRVEVPASFGSRQLEVLSPLGQVVKQQAFLGSTSEVNLQGLPAGMYIVRIHGATGSLTRRVLLTH